MTKDNIYVSNKLKEFIDEIQCHNRNPIDNSVLKMLEDIDTNPERIISPGGKFLYRSRVIHAKDKLQKKYPFFGFDEKGSFIPPPDCTRDMRANYRYIPYLYCATSPYLSIVEVRPRLGAKVSVARIKAKEELRLFDFSMQNRPKKMNNTKENLLGALSQLYSKPVTEDDDTLDYIPTQYIAEFVKEKKYDGIVFRSSQYYDEDNVNVVIFNYNKCEVTGSAVYKVEQNSYRCSMQDSSAAWLNMPPILRETSI